MYTYKGNLELYYETGFEGTHACILHDDRGIIDNKYHSLEWSVWFKDGDYLTVFDKDNSILWKSELVNNKKLILEHKCIIDYIPMGVDLKEWIRWFKEELKAEVITPNPVLAQK